MTGKSAAELEREAEAARASIVQTAEAIQNRMTPGRVIDDLNAYFRNSDGSTAFNNLKTQVRDNPLPLALVGAGFAWLFMGGGPKGQDMAEGLRSGTDGHDGDVTAEEVRRGAPGLVDPERGARLSGTGDTSGRNKGGGAMKSATSKASSAYESVSGTVSSAAGAAADTVSHAGERMSGAANSASSQARRAGSRAQRMFSDTLEQEPLIIGALGLAVGAAIAAMLPRTKVEDEYVGPYAEKAQQAAKDAVSRGAESAENVANEAYRAGEQEAEKQKRKKAGSSGSSSGSSSTGTRSTSTSNTHNRPAAAKPAGSSAEKVAQAAPASKGSEKKS